MGVTLALCNLLEAAEHDAQNGTPICASCSLCSPCKWVFGVKRDAQGNIERHKARLVARGYEQRIGGDVYETFAPVAHMDSVRTLIAVAAIRDYIMLQFDVSTAFLNGILEEEVYVDPPKEVKLGKGECLKLNKALYGLRQSPRAWNSCLNEALEALGMKAVESEPCIYTSEDRQIYLVVYVDDGLIIGKNEERCHKLVDALGRRFKIKLLNCTMFLGVEIKREEGNISLSQTRYINDILERFEMADCKGASSPILDIKTLVETNESEPTSASYREAIGCLMYVANCTRPDISYAVNLLARRCHAPTAPLWSAVKYVI